MANNETRMLSDDVNMTSDTQQQTAQPGSLRDLARKSSEFSWDANRLTREIESYPKNRRYVTLKLQNMYTELVSLYTKAFIHCWPHFKRINDIMGHTTNDAATGATYMARVYVAGWMIDLYTSNCNVIQKLTPVAFTQLYSHKTPGNSNEYDAFLAHLNNVIRPTHIKGCPEDTLYLPRFAEENKDYDWSYVNIREFNPFKVPNWRFDAYHFKAIIGMIKDKRSGWITAPISNETVGRPVWLFDWHDNNVVCAWFPRKDNFDSTDVTYAYLIGVSCTPTLAPQDTDEWRPAPTGTNAENPRLSEYPRINERRTFGSYEFTSLHNFKDLTIDTSADGPADESSSRVTTTAHAESKRHKRARKEHDGTDKTKPRAFEATTSYSATSVKPISQFRWTTYLYYERVIFEVCPHTRINGLFSLILDCDAFKVY